MAPLQDIRRRIASVRNTRKITKALELVASARLRRAQQRIEEMRPYADRMQELMVGTSRAAASLRNLPLMQRREEHRVGIVVFSGDRGLAGPFNGQVLRRAFELERTERADGHDIAAHWEGFVDKPTYHDAQAVAHRLAEMYIAEEVDRVVVVYNRYVSPLVQRVTLSDLLPIPEHVLGGAAEGDPDPKKEALRGDFIYEPEPEEILERLLPVYLETEIYRALLESAASFLASQMAAMRSASKNANDLIDRYTLQMNRARQAEITQEILEVVAGADALS